MDWWKILADATASVWRVFLTHNVSYPAKAEG